MKGGADAIWIGCQQVGRRDDCAKEKTTTGRSDGGENNESEGSERRAAPLPAAGRQAVPHRSRGEILSLFEAPVQIIDK